MHPSFRKCTLLIIGFFLLILFFMRYLFYNDQFTVMSAHRQRISPDAPILVSVYYEALCSDSKHFILKQLVPTYNRAKKIMNLELVPYGKATTMMNVDGSYKFDCQHGPAECLANKYHACTIDAIKNVELHLNMISCMIKDNNLPREAFQRCVRQYEINEEAPLIQKCANSTYGDNLLKLYGDATHALRPEISFIPTITLDGAQGRQASILKDLLAVLCEIAGHNLNAIEICQKHI